MLEKDPFGAQRIDKVRLSDAKEWLIRLQQVGKKSFSAIHSIRGVVRPAFQMATVLVNDSVTRETITRKQEKTFLEFIKNDAHYCKYYDGMIRMEELEQTRKEVDKAEDKKPMKQNMFKVV